MSTLPGLDPSMLVCVPLTVLAVTLVVGPCQQHQVCFKFAQLKFIERVSNLLGSLVLFECVHHGPTRAELNTCDLDLLWAVLCYMLHILLQQGLVVSAVLAWKSRLVLTNDVYMVYLLTETRGFLRLSCSSRPARPLLLTTSSEAATAAATTPPNLVAIPIAHTPTCHLVGRSDSHSLRSHVPFKAPCHCPCLRASAGHRVAR